MKSSVPAVRKELITDSIKTVEDLISRCPNPTQLELKKILAIQGSILNQIGLDLIAVSGSANGKISTQKLNLALKALSHSREALKASASIKI
jgi:hypothetical protein